MLSAEEREARAHEERSERANVFALFVLLGVSLPASAFAIGDWLFHDSGRLICAAIGCLPVAALALAYGVHASRSRGSDISGDEVEELSIEATRAVSLVGQHGLREPLLLLDVGDGQTLLLFGSWLFTHMADDDAPAANGFPNTRFTLARLFSSADVLSIANSGDYLAPTELTVEFGENFTSFIAKPSQVFKRSIDELLAEFAK